MPNARTVNVWKDANFAYMAAEVLEGGSQGQVEYSAQTPLLDEAGQAKPNAQLRDELRALVRTQRRAQQPAAQDIAGAGGTFDVT